MSKRFSSGIQAIETVERLHKMGRKVSLAFEKGADGKAIAIVSWN